MMNRHGGLASGLFVRIGASLPEAIVRRLAIVGERLALGAWWSQHGGAEVVENRLELIDLVASRLREGGTYLEFGVASGTLTRRFGSLNCSEQVAIHGFDSWVGLPEPHHDGVVEGSFSTEGLPPQIPDTRITWHAGWFEETLVNSPEITHPLALIMDADLYSSTAYVLRKLRSELQVGDMIYFDDLHIPNQERLALDEAIRAGLRLEPIARSREGRSGLFRVV